MAFVFVFNYTLRSELNLRLNMDLILNFVYIMPTIGL